LPGGHSVNAIVPQPDGNIVLGGFFNTYNGNAVPVGVTRLMGTSGAYDATFNPAGTGVDDDIYALARLSNSQILVGGSLTTYNGVDSPNSIIRLGAPPSVISVTRADANPTSASTVRFTVIFSESVTGVDITDFSPEAVGVTGVSITGVTGSGTTYTVTVNTGTGGGTIGLDVFDNDSIINSSGISLGGPGVDNGIFTDGEIYTVVRSTSTTGGTSLPDSGFAPGVEAKLPVQPLSKSYTTYNELWLDVPSLNQKMPVVGIPFVEGNWDVSWLGREAGWLNGTAFPTWEGNSVITAHVWDAVNNPGPFAGLKSLGYGDTVKIHAWGQVYTYEVRQSRLVSPANLSVVTRHEDNSWLTLVTCEDYSVWGNSYSYRRVVRAVLVDVVAEK
jgi:LPXTG-site transpeptidase (sortase) family protein